MIKIRFFCKSLFLFLFLLPVSVFSVATVDIKEIEVAFKAGELTRLQYEN